MDIQYFITFREAARSQSLTETADKLGYAQPTISVQIKKLEKHFGVSLFDRSSRHLRLSAAGIKLLGYADRIVEEFREAEESFALKTNMELSIGTSETLASYFLPSYLQQFRSKFPEASLLFFPLAETEMIQKIRRNELDLGLIINTTLSQTELRSITVRREELVFICTQEHPLAGKKAVSPTSLENSTMIMSKKGCAYRDTLERLIGKHDIRYQVISEMGSMDGIKQSVMFGMGIALVPRLAVETELQQGKLSCFTLTRDALPPFYTQIIINKHKHLSTSISYLISLFASGGETTLE